MIEKPYLTGISFPSLLKETTNFKKELRYFVLFVSNDGDHACVVQCRIHPILLPLVILPPLPFLEEECDAPVEKWVVFPHPQHTRVARSEVNFPCM